MKEVVIAIFETLWAIIAGIVGGVWDGAASFFEPPKKIKYNARFEDTESYFNTKGTGISVSGTLYSEISLGYEGSLIIGSSGIGKSVSVGYPTTFRLAESGVSMVILDFGGDYLKHTSGRLMELGYQIHEFNPSKKGTAKFNLLDLCTDKIRTQEYIQLFMSNAKVESKSDPFWANSSTQVIELFINICMQLPTTEQHLGTVLRLLEDFAAEPSKEIDKLVVSSQNSDLIRAYKAFCATPEKTRDSILITARIALKCFNIDILVENTSSTTIDVTSIRTVKQAIYITIPLTELEPLACIVSVFIQSLYNYLLSEIPARGSRGTFFIMDELAQLYFPNLSSVASVIRKHLGALVIISQSHGAMLQRYTANEFQNILSNMRVKVYLGNQMGTTAQEILKGLGKYSILDDDGNDTGSSRELMTVDELRTFEGALIFVGGHVMKTNITPYYKQKKLLKYSLIKPYQSGTDEA